MIFHPQMGWVPDAPDPRDLLFEPQVTPQDEVDLRAGVLSVYDQGRAASCTGQGTSAAVRFDRHRQGLPDFIPSRLFAYYQGRKVENTVPVDCGASIRDVIKSVNAIGIPDEAVWPYDITQFATEPSNEAYADALKHESVLYRSVNLDEESIFSCLSQGFPIVFGTTLFPAFESPEVAATGIVPMPDLSLDPIGGHCLDGSTPIPLLDGRTLTIEQLAAGAAGSEFWVYSADENGSIRPGRAHSARCTDAHADMVEIELDDGAAFRCTPDHRVLLREGKYREAGALVPGTSLMPLYRRQDERQLRGYEMVLDNSSHRWRYTHRVVAAEAAGGRYEGVIHHIDFDKRNNAPDNLVSMDWDEHTRLHQEQQVLLNAYARSAEGRKRSRRIMQQHWADPVWAEAQRARLRASASERARSSAAGKGGGFKAWDKQALREMSAANGKKSIGRRRSPESVARGVESLRRRIEADPDLAAKRHETALRNIAVAHQKRELGNPNNHKVVAVCPAPTGPVYDLTVDRYQNFALASGVFVHNCMMLAGGSRSRRVALALNSWGPTWGDGGYAIFPLDYILSPYLTSDLWTIQTISG